MLTGVQKIAKEAFYQDEKIRKVKMPDTVADVEKGKGQSKTAKIK